MQHREHSVRAGSSNAGSERSERRQAETYMIRLKHILQDALTFAVLDPLVFKGHFAPSKANSLISSNVQHP